MCVALLLDGVTYAAQAGERIHCDIWDRLVREGVMSGEDYERMECGFFFSGLFLTREEASARMGIGGGSRMTGEWLRSLQDSGHAA